jgi:eukaryotic-like serine/threonine-protein kinase
VSRFPTRSCFENFLVYSESSPNFAGFIPAKQAVPPPKDMSAPTVTLYEPGYVIAGKYELEAQLGQGGMGVVWRARNIALDSLVAIKVVRASSDHAMLRGRLMQEARAAAKLAHPAIVKVFDVGQTDAGDPFIVMELLEGHSLGDILETETRVPAVQAVRSLLPIADALWLAHGKGIVHRDLKPDNVFIVHHDGSIQPKLLDFGIVKVQDAEAQSHLTKAGDVLGSPDYMSPEQARGQDDVTHLTDIWSFCVVLYETIAGRTPFKGANYNALLRQIVEDTPPSLLELAATDAELAAIVARGMHKQADQRFASMGELGRALAKWLLSHGVSEDICGSTLEAKWLRGTDPHGRSGRPSMASITDGWPIERGSGVRRNEPGMSPNTLPAPLNSQSPPPELGFGAVDAGEEGATGSEPPLVLAGRPDGRPKWVPIASAAIVLVLGLAGFFVGRRLLSVPALPPPAATQAPVQAAPPQPEVVPEPVVPEAAASAPAPSDDENRDQVLPEKVSSPVGRASGVVRGARPARSPLKKSGTGSGKPPAKPGDLISPYQ